MILILSQEHDVTAMRVTSWLKHYNIPFLNIEDTKSFDIVNLITLNNKKTGIQFTYNNNKYSLNDFLFVWNRRGRFSFSKQETNSIQENLGIKNNSFYNHIANEGETLKDYVAYCLSKKLHIDDSRLYSINKLTVLDIAKQIGLNIPNTFITNDYKHIKNETTNLITKGIQGVIHFSGYNANHLHQRTQIVEKEAIEDAPEFYYSLFQQKIEKRYEIRTFIFFDKLFSMAIFSQNNEKTKVDFRNYDTEKQNRMVPYKLPENIEQKLLKLMKKLEIQSGSADLIFDGKDYVFLEINPVGQLDFVSGRCNYQIEKHIATFIKNKYNELKNNN